MRSVEDLIALVDAGVSDQVPKPWPSPEPGARPSQGKPSPRDAANGRAIYAKVAFKRHLMAHDDVAFVANAYQTILGRAPDRAGLALFLNGLREGTMTKDRIIDALVTSEEGARSGVVVLDPFQIRRFFGATSTMLWDLVPSPVGGVGRLARKALRRD